MYRRKNKGWLKHLDFIILDLLCLQVCFALAYFSRHGFRGNPHKVIYQNMMLVLVLFEFIYAFFLEGYKDILKRGHYVEFVSVVKQVCILELFISFYLIVVKDGDDFSRTVLFLLGIYQLGIGWMTRTIWKLHVKKYQTEEGNCSLLLITTSKMAEEALKRIRENNYQTYKLSGIVFMDCMKQEKQYQNIQIVLEKNMAEWVCNMEQDLISIVVPVYRAENYIEETLDCVRAQTYTNWELLLIEDCGPDRSRQIIEEYIRRTGDRRIRLLTHPTNLGAARARNLGVNEAKGRYLAYLDADDLWVPEKLEWELAFMKEQKAACVFTGYEFADENGVGTGKIVHVPTTINYKEALKNTTIFTSTVMFDMEQLSKEELQMPQIKSEDTALWWRILRGGTVACGLDENLVKYRRAGKSLSSNKIEALRRIWNLYRKAEGMSVPSSAWHFCFWAVRAVKRRI